MDRQTPHLAATGNPPRLLSQVSARLRTKHYSIRTERAYCDWVKRFVLFHDKRHPKEMGVAEIEEFLTHLAVAGRVAASTQNQAKSALLFLYKEVLHVDLPWLDNITQAKTPQRLPVVLTPTETKRFARSAGRHTLAHGKPALRRWVKAFGVPAVAGEGCGFRAKRDFAARW